MRTYVLCCGPNASGVCLLNKCICSHPMCIHVCAYCMSQRERKREIARERERLTEIERERERDQAALRAGACADTRARARRAAHRPL